MNKIGIQLYSVRDHLTTEEDARATFKKLRELGYTEAQTAGCYGMDYGVFGKLANDAGIEIVGTHDPFEPMVNDIETVNQSLSGTITQMITSITTIVGVLVMMLRISF